MAASITDVEVETLGKKAIAAKDRAYCLSIPPSEHPARDLLRYRRLLQVPRRCLSFDRERRVHSWRQRRERQLPGWRMCGALRHGNGRGMKLYQILHPAS